jgi:integrase
MGKLTALGLKGLKEPGRYSDGHGLFLVIGAGGAKSWVLRVQRDGRRRDIGLGSASKVSLADARHAATKAHAQIATGLDPVLERRRLAAMPTFEEAARAVYDSRRSSWKNDKHDWQWMRSLELFAFPLIGPMRVSDVEVGHLHEVLSPIWLKKPATARKLIARLGMVLDWAFAKGMRTSEAPIRSVRRGLGSQPKSVKHHAALDCNSVADFLTLVREKRTWGRLALEFTILTAARSCEARGAKWEEVDLQNRLWAVPASRMKAGKEHVVPLSKEAVDVLSLAKVLQSSGAHFIFEGARRDQPMSDMTLLKVIRDLRVPVTVHGFRSTFRDWVSEETSYDSNVAEAALAHAVKGEAERAYRRGNLLSKRREMMEAWGAYCDGLVTEAALQIAQERVSPCAKPERAEAA